MNLISRSSVFIFNIVPKCIHEDVIYRYALIPRPLSCVADPANGSFVLHREANRSALGIIGDMFFFWAHSVISTLTAILHYRTITL